MKNNKKLDQFYWRLRSTKALVRLIKKRKSHKSKQADTRFLYSRELHLDYFAQTAPVHPKKKLIKPKKSPSELVIKIPKVFSIYEEPEEVFHTIAAVAKVKNNKKTKSLYIDHSNCTKHGLGAETLLASAVSCLDKVKSFNGMRFNVRGIYPECDAMSRMIKYVGVVKEVNGNAKGLEKSEKDKTLVFRNESIPKEIIDSSGGDKKNQTCASFIEYFNNCLLKAGKELSDAGRQRLNEYTGEILDNATRHSGTNMWHIYMYMDYTNDDTLNVHVVVYSLGNTIYKNFTEKREISEVWDQFSRYLDTHKGKFTESDLVTVMSMQQTVTSNKELDNTGGLGTVNFIKFFEKVSNECHASSKNKPQMTIISGSSQLKFDGSIGMIENENGLNLMAFNESGNLDDAPDKKYVRGMGKYQFPGVLIGIKFPIKDGSELTL
jgi:hypothetical protein